MAQPRLDIRRDVYLEAIWTRLEEASALAAAADVEAKLDQITCLAREIAVLAEAGRILTQDERS